MRTLIHPARNLPVLTDVALLVARVALGFILLAHGWQKLTEYTLDGTASSFAALGVPAPTAAATFATVVEIGGGVALILGLLAPVAALLNVVNLLGALALVHAGNGVFVDAGGYELVLALIAGLLLITVRGAGRLSIDRLLDRSPTEPAEPAAATA